MKKHQIAAGAVVGCVALLGTSSLYAAEKIPACSVQLFDGKNFKDSHVVIQGAGEFKDLKHLPGADGKDWNDEADSIKVGSAATVQAWTKKNFKGKHYTFKPGTKHPKVKEPSSLKISCPSS